MHLIDLRSDTVTQPTQEMRDAMHYARVGDDVFDDDPTVKDLERFAARTLGKEAALFVTSGTQGNACAVLAQTRRGDCIVIAKGSHIEGHEGGSYAMLAGVSLRYPAAENGLMDPASVAACLTDDSDLQTARTGLVVIENAHSSGRVLPVENMRQVYEAARRAGVPVHLDGARLFNASTALGITDVREMTMHCDTVMCCLSKGLCAPVGSILAGPSDVIARAKKARKFLGGGMRQAGFLAAAGLLALRDMPPRLIEDHQNARLLGGLLTKVPGIAVEKNRVDIDMVFFKTDWDAEKAAAYPKAMRKAGFLVTGLTDGEYRLVTHYGVKRNDCIAAADAVRVFAARG